MQITLTVDDLKWGWLLSKTAADKSDPNKLVLDKVNEYLDACGRDVGASDLAKVQAALADPANLAIAKASLGL